MLVKGTPMASDRPVKCVECGITWPSHPDFLNHLAALERHADIARPSDTYADLAALAEAALAEKAGNDALLAEMRRKRQFLPRWIDDSRQAEYRAAANPTRILALLADLDAARGEVERLRGACICFEDYGDGQRYANSPNQDCPLHGITARAERDALAAKVEAVRALCDRADAAAADPEVIKMSWADSRTVAVDDLRRAIGGTS